MGAAVATVALASAVPFAGRAAAVLGGAPASAPGRRPPLLHVVQPGETLWSIARSRQPHGDVRPLVGALVRANGGAALAVGDRVVIPNG
jgi:Tfp pilus assembly protein FimV